MLFAKKLESFASLALWERWRAEGVTERDTGIAYIPIRTSFREYTNLLFPQTEKAVSKLSSIPNFKFLVPMYSAFLLHTASRAFTSAIGSSLAFSCFFCFRKKEFLGYSAGDV